ncbi:hypothetical protein L4K55_004172 [Salmonella enterica]|nr:hypothetical protein [Salmonella enterica]
MNEQAENIDLIVRMMESMMPIVKMIEEEGKTVSVELQKVIEAFRTTNK